MTTIVSLVRTILLCTLVVVPLSAQTLVRLTAADGATIMANLYGSGSHGIVLAHGGRFNKESWHAQAVQLADSGFRLLAVDFRGYGDSRGPGDDDPLAAPLHLDILAGVAHLRSAGCARVSVVGGSMGGMAGAAAVIASGPGVVDRLVLLGTPFDGPPEKVAVPTLVIVASGDTTARGIPRLVRIRELFARMPGPKELVVVDGTAHAQYLFGTPHAQPILRRIVTFLRTP